MTEQEARIKRLKVFMYAEKVKLYNGLFDDLNECIKALEKQIPKKVKEIHVDEYYCPSCGSENNCNDRIVGHKYCPNCGQRFWGNEDAE